MPAVVSVTRADTGTDGSSSVDLTISGSAQNAAIIVVIAWAWYYGDGRDEVSSIVYDPGGQNLSFSQKARVDLGANNEPRLDAWTLVVGSFSGPKTVRVTFSGTTIAGLFGILVQDVHQTTPFGSAVTAANPSGGAISINVPTASGDVAFDAYAVGNRGTLPSPGSGQTIWDNFVFDPPPTGTGWAVRSGGSTKSASGTSTTMSWSAGRAQIGFAIKPASTPVSRSFTLGYEALMGVILPWTMRFEATGFINRVLSPKFEATGLIVATKQLPYESTAAATGVSRTITSPYEATGAITRARTSPYESLVSALKQLTFAYEALATAIRTRTLPYEALAAIFATDTFPFEAEGVASISKTVTVPFEAVGRVSATKQSSYEALGQVNRALTRFYESLLGVSRTLTLPYESATPIVSVSRTYTLFYEALARVARTLTEHYEARGLIWSEEAVSPTLWTSEDSPDSIWVDVTE